MARLRNVTIDCERPEQLSQFWQAALGYTLNFSNEWVAELVPPADGQPRMLLLKVPEPKTGKNRVHVDLEAEDRVAEVQRLVALEAVQRETHDEYGINWTVMNDPGGNEFCVVRAHD